MWMENKYQSEIYKGEVQISEKVHTDGRIGIDLRCKGEAEI